jgi:hypothetical protein
LREAADALHLEARQLTLARREREGGDAAWQSGQATEGQSPRSNHLGRCDRPGSRSPRLVQPAHFGSDGRRRPAERPEVPKTLNWDLWLGPAKYRPYHPTYLPFSWRSWWDFGTGVLGDIGCHQLDPVFRALKLGYPLSVEACSSNMDEPAAVKEETAPKSSIVRFEFPAREGFPPLALTWYDGGLMPQRPPELEEGRKFGEADDNLFVGEKGKMLGYRLIPEARMKEYGKPPQKIERSPGHHREWIDACRGGKPARANFDWAGPLTEVVLLGNVALKMERQLYEKGIKLRYDGPNMQVTNLPEANRYIRDEYRDGWSL